MDIKGYKSNRIRISRRELIRYLESLGYTFERQSKTKHEIYKNYKTNKCIPVSITKGRDVSPRYSICYTKRNRDESYRLNKVFA